jgi:3-hydroxyisobutyrate dehydrogenase-like beta-hydroxyacid dehydrogenase
MTMLADDPAVEGAVYGDAGILKSLRKGGVHISLSTIGVRLSERLTAEHAKAGQEYVAAPVFGRPDAAEGGRLTVAAAGRRETLERYKPLFKAMGPKLFMVGERPALANVVKLSGNFLIASAVESLSEAIAFARKSGVDAAVLLEFLTGTLFAAPVYKTYGTIIVEGKYEPAGFALPLGLKDVRLVLQAAEAQNVAMPVASVVRDRMLTALARGHEKKDWSVIGRVAAEDAGLVQRA